MKYIFACDPGGTNGWVCGRYDEQTPFILEESGEMRDMIELGLIYEGWLLEHDREPITVIESWVTHHNQFYTDANLACQPIGMLRWIARVQGAPDPVFQIPSVRSGITDEMLRKGDYWLKGGQGHRREAMRHLLMYLSNQLHTPTMLKIRVK